ncbi:glucan biosynthesis protein D [Pokkaliibacter plantistimulans]|nr:glucan biosynthesis protein D [Pokkaliibacter plantistimulans]
MMNRRDFLKTASVASLLSLPVSSVLAAASSPAIKTFGKAKPFDLDSLKEQARILAGNPYDGTVPMLPEPLARLTQEQATSIHFRRNRALWNNAGTRLRTEFFHLSPLFRKPVMIFEVVNGKAQQLAYDPALFDYGMSGIKGEALPQDLGFAGFRLYLDKDWSRDVVSFLGASYFRAVGSEMQYGLSARGLAINTAMDQPEEFPDFTQFWLERPEVNSKHIKVYALLDSASTTGAYMFDIDVENVLVMNVDVTLFPRKDIGRLGMAPITSMYMIGENDKRADWDWRPEIHDSDGLAMHRGNGEWVWRPLSNPRHLAFNVFTDASPKGFGLLQRDRRFDHYQDPDFNYELRPNLWIEPTSDWGTGSVQLVEIPTDDETFDNVVAYWNPEQPAKAGVPVHFSYRMSWGTQLPAEMDRAWCVSTYTGLGGEIGKKRAYYSKHFSVDFGGGQLPSLPDGAQVDAIITLSRGRLERLSVRQLPQIKGFRAMFDVVPPDDSEDPITIRLFLKNGDQALSETWLYQWSPPPASERDLHNAGHLTT